MTKDLYKEKAAEMFKVSVDAVTPEQRAFAKRSCYVNIYSVTETTNEKARRELGWPIKGGSR